MVRPKCTQCFRAQRDCPGYPPPPNDRFLDQTAEVIAKARFTENARNELVRSNLAMSTELPRSLSQPLEARATSFFLSKYVQGSSFEYLPGLYSPSGQEEHLSASVEAVGLASLANELCSMEVHKESKARYIRAIQATNVALRCPVSATRDSTLVSVLLLGLFEAITRRTQLTLYSWEKHVKGALELIKMRGHQQVDTHLGLQLLKQASGRAVISAIRNKAEIPAHIISLVTAGFQYAIKEDMSWSFAIVHFRFTNLLAAINAGSLSDPEVIITVAMDVDQDLVAWSRALPPSWQYEIVYAKQVPSESTYEGYYHLYRTHKIAETMNAWRMTRIQVNRIIVEQVLRQNSMLIRVQENAALMCEAQSNVRRMASEICATVPQYVELPDRASISGSTTQHALLSSNDTPKHNDWSYRSGFTHTTQSYGIIWPLMVVAACPSPDSTRPAWIVNRLQYIGRHMKNPQALLAFDILEGKREIGELCILPSKGVLHWADLLKQEIYVSPIMNPTPFSSNYNHQLPTISHRQTIHDIVAKSSPFGLPLLDISFRPNVCRTRQ